MENQSKLLEMLQEMKQIAMAQQNHLTKKEIKEYLGESFGNREMIAIYQYLGENGITVEGYDYVPPVDANTIGKEEETISSESENNEIKEIDKDKSEHFENQNKQDKKIWHNREAHTTSNRSEENMRLYEQELAGVSENRIQEEKVIINYLKGQSDLRNQIIEWRLQHIIEIARKYEKRQVPQDELIAEGNLALMVAMQIIDENKDDYLQADGNLNREKFYGILDMEVTQAMENYIDEMISSSDQKAAMLAKTNLLHEATKYMTEEMGRVPTISELSEYTKIDREEIKSIMDLSEDAKRVAQSQEEPVTKKHRNLNLKK